ncbi:MAG: LysR family transcriptional regulator [Halioglobus sp.]|nr:LysR family transcriptional regulator [Halioglobus sp.]
MKINLRSTDLNLLTVFEAIWEERQMSRAATRLGMTQPAASQALARLRITFDDTLFLRSHKGMLPTPRASALAGPITSALDQLREVVTRQEAFDPDNADRTFTIAFARFGELNLFPALLQSISAHHGVRIRSHAGDSTEVFDLLKKHTVDFGFDHRKPEDSNLHHCLFEQEEMVVIARADHPRLDKRLSRKQYFEERHIVLTVSDERRAFLENVFSASNAQRHILAEADQAVALPSLVMGTDALATIPRSMAETSLFAKQIRIYKLPLQIPRLPIYMIWHRALDRDPGHLWMKSRLIQCRDGQRLH